MAVTGPTAWNNPDAFVGRATLSAYEPYALQTGSTFSSTPPASAAFIRWNQPQPVALGNAYLQASLSASVPQATSQASAGSEGYTYGVSAYLYSRQDYAANSTNLSPVDSASFAISASVSYTSTAQTFGMSWVTDATGGASNLTTTSNAGGWSAYISGARLIPLPFATTLTAGEYFLGVQHSSTTATSNSNVTLMSASMLLMTGQQAAISANTIGALATNAGLWFNAGLLTVAPTFSTTMASSVVTIGDRPFWIQLSNA